MTLPQTLLTQHDMVKRIYNIRPQNYACIATTLILRSGTLSFTNRRWGWASSIVLRGELRAEFIKGREFSLSCPPSLTKEAASRALACAVPRDDEEAYRGKGLFIADVRIELDRTDDAAVAAGCPDMLGVSTTSAEKEIRLDPGLDRVPRRGPASEVLEPILEVLTSAPCDEDGLDRMTREAGREVLKASLDCLCVSRFSSITSCCLASSAIFRPPRSSLSWSFAFVKRATLTAVQYRSVSSSLVV